MVEDAGLLREGGGVGIERTQGFPEVFCTRMLIAMGGKAAACTGRNVPRTVPRRRRAARTRSRVVEVRIAPVGGDRGGRGHHRRGKVGWGSSEATMGSSGPTCSRRRPASSRRRRDGPRPRWRHEERRESRRAGRPRSPLRAIHRRVTRRFPARSCRRAAPSPERWARPPLRRARVPRKIRPPRAASTASPRGLPLRGGGDRLECERRVGSPMKVFDSWSNRRCRWWSHGQRSRGQWSEVRGKERGRPRPRFGVLVLGPWSLVPWSLVLVRVRVRGQGLRTKRMQTGRSI